MGLGLGLRSLCGAIVWASLCDANNRTWIQIYSVWKYHPNMNIIRFLKSTEYEYYSVFEKHRIIWFSNIFGQNYSNIFKYRIIRLPLAWVLLLYWRLPFRRKDNDASKPTFNIFFQHIFQHFSRFFQHFCTGGFHSDENRTTPANQRFNIFDTKNQQKQKKLNFIKTSCT